MTVSDAAPPLTLSVPGPGVIASLLFIFLNFPSAGGTVAPQLLPGFWRFLNHFWIGAAGLDANRNILYFEGAGVGTDVLKILAWVATRQGWWRLALFLSGPYLMAAAAGQWSPLLVAGYLALVAEDAKQRKYPLREVFNGLRYIVKTGVQWRLMAHDLPPWPVVYQQTQRWLAAGCFEPSYRDGDLQCSSAGDCPPGMHCAAGRCYLPGSGPQSQVYDLGAHDLATARRDLPPADLGASDLASPLRDLSAPPDLAPVVVSVPPAYRKQVVRNGGYGSISRRQGSSFGLGRHCR